MTIRGWNDSWQAIFDALGRMKGSWPTRGWSWDPRLSCCCSSFTIEQEPAARAATALALPSEFTSSSIARAPQQLRDVTERAGGIRSGQIALCNGPLSGLLVYGLWWPWGDGETISLRVGLADVDPHREPSMRFRDLFGASL